MLLLSLKISHPNTLHTPLWSRQHKRPPRVTNESAGSWFLHSAAPNTLAHSWWQALRPRLPHHRWLSKRRTVTRLTSNVGQRHRHKLFTGPAPRTIYYRRELTCARSPTHARICIFINNKQNNKVFLLMCGWSIHACLEINSQPVIASASNMSKRQRGRESERFSRDGRALHVCLPDPARKVVKTNLRFAQLGVHVLDFSHRWCTLSFHPRRWKWRKSKLYEYNKEYHCFNHFITIMKLITFGSFLIT